MISGGVCVCLHSQSANALHFGPGKIIRSPLAYQLTYRRSPCDLTGFSPKPSAEVMIK